LMCHGAIHHVGYLVRKILTRICSNTTADTTCVIIRNKFFNLRGR